MAKKWAPGRREMVKNKQGDGKFRAGRREKVKMSREKGDGFQAGRRGL